MDFHMYTQQFLIGRNVFNYDVLKQALGCLHEEIQPDFNSPEPFRYFRRCLVTGLFYEVKILFRRSFNFAKISKRTSLIGILNTFTLPAPLVEHGQLACCITGSHATLDFWYAKESTPP